VDPDQWRTTVCREVAHAFQQERERQGLSLNAMGKRAGLSYQMIRFVETGERMPTLDTLLRMAAAIELDLARVIETALQSAGESGNQEITED